MLSGAWCFSSSLLVPCHLGVAPSSRPAAAGCPDLTAVSHPQSEAACSSVVVIEKLDDAMVPSHESSSGPAPKRRRSRTESPAVAATAASAALTAAAAPAPAAAPAAAAAPATAAAPASDIPGSPAAAAAAAAGPRARLTVVVPPLGLR